MSQQALLRAMMAAAAAIGLGSGGPSAADNLVTNPGFEHPSGFLTSWTTLSGTFAASSSAHSGSFAAATKGAEFFQTSSLTVGETYELSLWAFSDSSMNRIRISSIALSPLAPLDLTNAVTGTYQQYISAPFVANGSSVSLRVLANGGAGGTIYLDDLCLDLVGGVCGAAAPIPEPATAWMMLSALGLFALLGRYAGFRSRMHPTPVPTRET